MVILRILFLILFLAGVSDAGMLIRSTVSGECSQSNDTTLWTAGVTTSHGSTSYEWAAIPFTIENDVTVTGVEFFSFDGNYSYGATFMIYDSSGTAPTTVVDGCSVFVDNLAADMWGAQVPGMFSTPVELPAGDYYIVWHRNNTYSYLGYRLDTPGPGNLQSSNGTTWSALNYALQGKVYGCE